MSDLFTWVAVWAGLLAVVCGGLYEYRLGTLAGLVGIVAIVLALIL